MMKYLENDLKIVVPKPVSFGDGFYKVSISYKVDNKTIFVFKAYSNCNLKFMEKICI